MLKVNILTDNPRSWIVKYIPDLIKTLNQKFNIQVHHFLKFTDDVEGDVLLALSCERILTKEQLARHKYTLVAHPSKLPQGKGWSPLAWQILEGSNSIPITLFNANEFLDAGDIFYVENIELDGHELNDEIKLEQFNVTVNLINKFFENYENLTPIKQNGESTFYKKRRLGDSYIDINTSIKDNFDLFRISDNELYPVRFKYLDNEYVIKIYKA